MAIVILSAVAAAVVMAFIPRIPQSQSYHTFADNRVVFGIPHFGDVVTNLAFVVVGAFGLRHVVRARRGKKRDASLGPVQAWGYGAFFAGVGLVGFGSSWYHLAPSNNSLVWDRLPMSIAFMGLFSAVIGERVSRRAGLWLLPVLSCAGIGSVLYWHFTERAGAGDLRPYALVQYYPMLAVALILVLFRTGPAYGVWAFAAAGSYAVAKVCEYFDATIFAATGVISGHSVKHLASALAVWFVLLMLQRRRPTNDSSSGDTQGAQEGQARKAS